jgi:acyl-CoA hydrolase
MKTVLRSRVREEFERKIRPAEEAVKLVRSGDRVYVSSNCGQPAMLTEALCARRHELHGVEVVHLLTAGPAGYVDEQFAEHFRHLAYFIGANVRKAVQSGAADYCPIFLGEIPYLFTSGQVPIDVAMVACTPPDEHGYCSMGVSVDIGLAACRAAKIVIAEMNDQMPRTLGEGFLHVSDVDCFVQASYPVFTHETGELDDASLQIGRNIAALVRDGATLQLGIGAIPNAVLAALTEKNDLGVHTEMFSDGVIDLIERGNITCRKKTLHPNKVVSTFTMGSQHLYEYIDNNPFFEFRPTEYVNDPFVIAQNDGMVAVNGCIEIDLTGQVVSDSIGTKFYSGIGGQVDFVRGAARSKGGKPFLAAPSTVRNGESSRIVPVLKRGAGVVTSRGDVHYIVTEHGVAYLHGKSIRDRAISLIRIADPKFRDELLDQAKELGYVPKVQPSVEHRYPVELVQEVKLKTGEPVTLRPILPTDEQLLKKHFYSLSPETVHKRFNRMVSVLTNGTVRDLVNVDYTRHMAMVAMLKQGEGELLLATSRYYLDDTTNTAEVAFAVLDEWQCKGIGRALLRSLIERAKATKVKALEGWVQQDNAPMLKLLMTSGVETEYRIVEGQYRVTLWLTPQKTPV